MLVNSILRSAGTQDEILGYWGVAEQHRSIQHDLSCHISIPRRRNSRSAVQLIRQCQAEVIVREVRFDNTVNIGNELCRRMNITQICKLLSTSDSVEPV